jgi:hypothetical protein
MHHGCIERMPPHSTKKQRQNLPLSFNNRRHNKRRRNSHYGNILWGQKLKNSRKSDAIDTPVAPPTKTRTKIMEGMDQRAQTGTQYRWKKPTTTTMSWPMDHTPTTHHIREGFNSQFTLFFHNIVDCRLIYRKYFGLNKY